MSVNGRLEFRRKVYWNATHGTIAPLDSLLGIEQERYSTGVREMACRMSLNEAFCPASENLYRLAQLRISKSALRDLVQREGQRIERSIRSESWGPDWTSNDCTDQTVIVGVDGVMVPLVTDEQKRKRRATEQQKRRREKRRTRRGRPKSGSDGAYKEFKIASFYDPDKSHQYAVGTAGDHQALGRRMRRQAGKIDINSAKVKYSVIDGAEWIEKQLDTRLPMLDEKILDYYHLRTHVIETGHALYGEGTAKSVGWTEEMMGIVWTQGSMVLLDRLGNYVRRHRQGPKRQALDGLRNYITKRVDMTDYPTFRDCGYDCGSGPTESFCGCLTKRLKGRGMRWDRDNAESIMALGSVYYSNLWKTYWQLSRAA